MMESFLLFFAFIIALMLFLSTGISVAVAMGMIGVIGTILFISPNALAQLSSITFSNSTSFVLMVVPMFVLMTEVISSSPIGAQVFRTTQLWLGRFPGALGMGTVLTSTGFAAICGSSPVTAAAIGKIAVPEMIKQGYSQRLAIGATAAGGTLGILIPPSVALILYGVITETSIGKLFIAGFLPGALIAVLLCLTFLIIALVKPEMVPVVRTKVKWSERFLSLRSVLPIVILVFFVMGSIYTGFTTPTESAAIGASTALAIVGLMGYLGRKNIIEILSNTVKTTGMFLFLVIGGVFSAFVLNRLGIPQSMATSLLGLDIPGWVIIVLINILLLVLGMFLDPMSILVIVIPLFFPTVTALGYDPIWFGIMVTINIEIAAISPPVGFNLFVLKSVVPDVSLGEIIKGALIFIVPLLIGLIIIILFPEISLFLPNRM
ncbi:TRAP transporter large permease [Mesobacillus boroniphilus]|uniref:TRAP transporter large permease n=1 Tax=Mesobacillus boroniphilus TaxID=308892 RepID=A0A944CP12_9BACI|nr:TRAP transporter large permease [Mesobacillus boroniphilus]MBS8266494.1 TRAP transporter large permease [Mesobacillus boroniphilus]